MEPLELKIIRAPSSIEEDYSNRDSKENEFGRFDFENEIITGKRFIDKFEGDFDQEREQESVSLKQSHGER